eukprot:TRINITY_DN8312_c0_g1_i1.p1 TRINITY_DN8312_c0_g1~~TRINITY_DN8312_c0_g1_i1.p1  ORF type:complete len:674 (+),score=143.72 TRINITY_DN8312_c0_g1_i1:28-2049(+)
MSRPLPAPQPSNRNVIAPQSSTKRAGPTNTSSSSLPPKTPTGPERASPAPAASITPPPRTANPPATSSTPPPSNLARSVNLPPSPAPATSSAAPLREQMNSSTGTQSGAMQAVVSANGGDLWKLTQQEVDNTLEVIGDGYHVLDRSQKLMRRIIQLHAALAKDIRSLVEYEREKLPALSAKPSMDTQILSNWSGFLDISLGLADGYDKFASVGANHVYNPLAEQFENAKLLVKEAETQTKGVYGSIEKFSSLVEKSHARTVKGLQQFQGKVNLKNAVPKGDAKKCKTELQTYQKILDILEAHQTTVDSCNEAVADMSKESLQGMIRSLQIADEKRNELMNYSLAHYSTTMHVLAELGVNNDKRTKDFAEALPKQKRSLDVALQNISNAFSGGVKKVPNGGSAAPKLFSFAIPVDKAAVEERIRFLQIECGEAPMNMNAAMMAAMAPSPDEYKADDVCFFSHGKVDELLRFENELLGADNEEVQLVRYLIEQLCSLNGTSSQGIFRKTPDIRVLNAVKEKLVAGEYTLMGCDDPNVPAELIKQFLRNLSDPLIPMEHYEYCIGVARAIDVRKGPSEEVWACFEDLLFPDRWIPQPSLMILRRLAGFIKVASDADHIELTKMTYSNFAIVLAPNMIRCKPGSLDPQTQIKNTELESRFIEYLFRYVIDYGLVVDV